MMKRGRPSLYSPELAKEICEQISCRNVGIKRLCIENSHWPNKDTIFTWLKVYQDFSDQYAQAKLQQVESLVDEILLIADDASQNIEIVKLRIDVRKWLVSKLAPKVYNYKFSLRSTRTY